MPRLAILLAALALGHAGPAAASALDGTWAVTMVCPPHQAASDDALGYTHRFKGQVAGRQFSATYGTENQPGWHHLRGRIADDGSATLRLDGIVDNARHAINGAQRGKPYTYRVKAQFDARAGTGQRLTGRRCDFQFDRQDP
ncbi:MAG: hypothetical protein ACKVQR_08040 [Aquabacterium sp.]